MVDPEPIKEKVLRRWCNSILLPSIHTCIEDLSLDVQDGVKLCALLQLLSKESVPHFKNPDQQERKKNIDAVVAFVKNSGCVDDQAAIYDAIVKGNTKAVCSLIWSIIICYQIKPLLTTQAMSIYEAVKHLINSKLPPDHQVHNFTSDWKDGAVLTKLAIDSLPSTWNPDELNILDAIEKYLEVPKILFYEELQSPDIDEDSIVTYVTSLLTKLAQQPSASYQAFSTESTQTPSNILSFTVHTSIPVANGSLQRLVTDNPPYSPQGIIVEISAVAHSDEVAVACLADVNSTILTSNVKVVVMYTGSSTAQNIPTIINTILCGIAGQFNTSIYFEQTKQDINGPPSTTYGWMTSSGSLI